MNVLSVDGGGIRGVIPAMVLADLEERTGKHTAELFDLIAGTSTGGIIALALTVPGENGKPRWTANDLVDLYLTEGPRIFHHSIGQMLESGLGLLDEKYDARPLEQALEDYLGEANISEAVTDVMGASYDLEHRKPFFFKSDRAKLKPEHDWLMREAARATSAAPTYFEPEKLTADGEVFALCDGGVFANNPAMSAYAEARRRHPRAEIRLVSLGTGQLTRKLHYEDVRGWGLIEWARPCSTSCSTASATRRSTSSRSCSPRPTTCASRPSSWAPATRSTTPTSATSSTSRTLRGHSSASARPTWSASLRSWCRSRPRPRRRRATGAGSARAGPGRRGGHGGARRARRDPPRAVRARP